MAEYRSDLNRHMKTQEQPEKNSDRTSFVKKLFTTYVMSIAGFRVIVVLIRAKYIHQSCQ